MVFRYIILLYSRGGAKQGIAESGRVQCGAVVVCLFNATADNKPERRLVYYCTWVLYFCMYMYMYIYIMYVRIHSFNEGDTGFNDPFGRLRACVYNNILCSAVQPFLHHRRGRPKIYIYIYIRVCV